jgi:3'-phosphoadenosine 5'-phosphosulfate sulfotransferase (PAPS reductase)/FAD synthetase
MTKVFCGISGKDSACAALVYKAFNPDANITYFFNDVGAEYPELYAWLEQIKVLLQQDIEFISADLHKIIEQETSGDKSFLPSRKQRYCTRKAKIEPMEKFFKESTKEPCQIVYGLRYDERDRVGYIPVANSNITPVYPLIERKISIREVYEILAAKNALPPFHRWNRLESAVIAQLGTWWMNKLPFWYVNTLLKGRSRDNCYFCFNQSAWEFLYLMETHPDLYEKAASYEKNGYSWVRNLDLKEFRANKKRQDKVFNMRLNKVIGMINKAIDNDFEFEDNELALTSCGLLCGK